MGRRLNHINLLIFLLSFILLRNVSESQIVKDTLRGTVGEELCINFSLLNDTTIIGSSMTFRGKFKLSNPTVFYPENLVKNDKHTIAEATIKRFNDSIYTFSIIMNDIAVSDKFIGFSLCGEALAGSDSICVVYFTDDTLNDYDYDNFKCVIITKSIGTPLPYIRFATLEQNYPNPVPGGISTKWFYRIDKTSEIVFSVIDYLGRETVVEKLNEQPEGINEFSLVPSLFFISGLYWLKMTTNSGSVIKPFIILN